MHLKTLTSPSTRKFPDFDAKSAPSLKRREFSFPQAALKIEFALDFSTYGDGKHYAEK